MEFITSPYKKLTPIQNPLKFVKSDMFYAGNQGAENI
jgi:hypothetical protein